MRLRSVLGWHVARAIAEVVQSSDDIELVEFVRVPAFGSAVQDRVSLTPAVAAVLRRALELRERTGLPFWDSAMVSSFGVGPMIAPLVAASVHHNARPPTLARLSRTNCTQENIRALGSRCPAGQCVGLVSAVTVDDGTIRHLPMLDFHLPSGSENQATAVASLNAVRAGRGLLVESGKSYHFLGIDTVSSEELWAFLARALLLGPLVDRAWIAHQLLEGRCALRVSSRVGQANMPKVVIAYDADDAVTRDGTS